jgi:hypothetical protein
MLLRGTVGVYCQKCTKHRMQSFDMLKQVVRIVTTGLQWVNTLTAVVLQSRIFVTGRTVPLSPSQDGESMRVGLNTRQL